MSVVREAMDAEIAALERETAAPTPPFGYGADLRCASDLHEDMAEVAGDSLLALAEAIVRRLTCPRGAIPDSPDYGLDLRGYCNRGSSTAELRALAGRVRSEVLKDDRVDQLTVTVRPSVDASELTVELVVTPVDRRLGGFSLTLAVTSAAVLIDELRAAS